MYTIFSSLESAFGEMAEDEEDRGGDFWMIAFCCSGDRLTFGAGS